MVYKCRDSFHDDMVNFDGGTSEIFVYVFVLKQNSTKNQVIFLAYVVVIAFVI